MSNVRPLLHRFMLEELFSLSWLKGSIVSSVELEVEAKSWSLCFGNNSRLYVPCLWRLIGVRGLLATSEDHGQRFGLPQPFDALSVLAALEGKVVLTVVIRPATNDLTLEFEGDRTFEVVNSSAGFEGWSASHPVLGTVFVASGGELNAAAGA